SELDAIVAFWLVAAALLVNRPREVRPVRVVLVLLLGTGLFYLLLAVRLCGLVLAGEGCSPHGSVSLAPLRVTRVGFSWLSVALLSGTYRWWRPPGAARESCPSI